jgi:hypothetical protein
LRVSPLAERPDHRQGRGDDDSGQQKSHSTCAWHGSLPLKSLRSGYVVPDSTASPEPHGKGIYLWVAGI